MFEIYYKIVCNEYDEFVGQNGFFQIRCNNCVYGEVYSEEIEKYMETVSLVDWFERLIKVARYLDEKNYVALSDVESHNTWIVFQKKDKNLLVSIVKAEKKDNSHSIEFKLDNISSGEWEKQVVVYEQFINELFSKVKEYISFIFNNNDNRIKTKMKSVFYDLT